MRSLQVKIYEWFTRTPVIVATAAPKVHNLWNWISHRALNAKQRTTKLQDVRKMFKFEQKNTQNGSTRATSWASYQTYCDTVHNQLLYLLYEFSNSPSKSFLRALRAANTASKARAWQKWIRAYGHQYQRQHRPSTAHRMRYPRVSGSNLNFTTKFESIFAEIRRATLLNAAPCASTAQGAPAEYAVETANGIRGWRR